LLRFSTGATLQRPRLLTATAKQNYARAPLAPRRGRSRLKLYGWSRSRRHLAGRGPPAPPGRAVPVSGWQLPAARSVRALRVAGVRRCASWCGIEGPLQRWVLFPNGWVVRTAGPFFQLWESSVVSALELDNVLFLFHDLRCHSSSGESFCLTRGRSLIVYVTYPLDDPSQERTLCR